MRLLRTSTPLLLLLLLARPGWGEEHPIDIVRPMAAKVTVRENNERLGVAELGFANGVRCYVKSMPSSEKVVCRFTFVGGISEETQETRAITEAALVALRPGVRHTKKYASKAIDDFLGKAAPVQIVPNLGVTEVHLDLVSSPARIEDALGVARALVLGAVLPPGALRAWKTQTGKVLAYVTASTAQQAIQARSRLTTNGDVRAIHPQLAQITGLSLDTVQAWLDRLLRHAPLVVSIAGPIDPERGRKLMAAYVGSLPKRETRTSAVLALHETGPWVKRPVTRMNMSTAATSAVCQLGWPLIGTFTPRERAALRLGAEVLKHRLSDVLSEELGVGHAVQCWLDGGRYRGADGLWFLVSTAPRNVDRISALIGADVEKLIAVKAPLAELDAARTRLQMTPTDFSPERWVYELSMLPGTGESLAHLAERAEDTASVDSKTVRAVLSRVVRRETARTIIVSTPRRERPVAGALSAGEEGDLFIKGSDFSSRVFLPLDYVKGKRLPVVLHLHGSGDRPSTGMWRAATKDRGAIIVGLSYGGQADGGAGGVVLGDPESCRSGAAYIRRVVAALNDHYGIDESRIVLAGFSMGGWGVNFYGFLRDAVQEYCGFAILGAGTTEAPTVDLSLAKGRPVLLLNGENDPNLSHARTGKAALTAAGANVTQVILPGEGHVPSASALSPALARWLTGVIGPK